MRQIETIPDDGMNKDIQNSEVNIASANYYEPLVDMDINGDTKTSPFT